ncbi:MAG TPA: hypothetical protein VFZ65_10600 [Planctomycetota bacterium]|nr:hypothetical protein [Planctomycetota bacterium]
MATRLATLLPFCMMSAGLCALPGQQLVREIAPGHAPLPSNPQLFTSDGSRAFFQATTAAEGSELWVTDGTTAGTHMVADLVPGAQGCGAWPALQTGGRLLFWATLPGLGIEPWSTDGTAAGTFLLADLDPSSSTVNTMREFGAVNGRVVFWHSARGLLAADLSQPGVTVLATGMPGNGGVTHGGRIYFIGSDGQLWVTDATAAGTGRLLPGTSLTLYGLFPGGSHMLFIAPVSGVLSIWRTDGTAAGTGVVGPMPLVNYTSFLPVANGAVFLGGSSVWFCNAATAPTAIAPLPAPYAPLASPSLVAELGTIGSRAVFKLSHIYSRSDLITTDGTAAGTYFLPMPGPESVVWFASDGVLGYMTRAGATHSLWVTDGTPGLVAPVASLPGNPAGIWSTNGRALLSIADPSVGRELFAFEPGNGLQLVRDIEPGRNGIWRAPVAAVGERLFFLANPTTLSSTHKYHLWVSDGTSAGTQEVVDYGPTLQAWPQPELVAFGDRVVFAGSSPNHAGLFVSDGTAAGTQPFLPGIAGDSQLRRLRSIDGSFWWIDHGLSRVYRSDGTAAGTAFLQLSSTPWDYVCVDGLVFVADGLGIVRSDLTPAGTWRIDPPSTAAVGLLGRLGPRVLYERQGQTGAWDVRSADGATPASTPLLQVPYGHATTLWNEQAWIRGLHGANDLWRTDGTPSGSAFVGTLAAGVTIDAFRPAADSMYFVGADAVEGAELWRSTGQPASTLRVTSLLRGRGSGVRDVWPVGTGHRVFVAGGDYTTGCELFVSDGTRAGTSLVADIAPGAGSSNPEFLDIAGSKLFFLADDGTTGRELWVVDLATLAVANVQPLWGGCGGSPGRPQLSTLTAPRLGEAGFGFRVARVLPGAAVVLAKSTTIAAASLGACTVLPGGAFVTLGSFANASGVASFSIPVPAAVSLLGFTMYAQAGGLDSAGAGAGFAVSDAVEIVVGG